MYQALITRFPYASRYDANIVLEQAKQIDARGLIFVSVPIHVEKPLAPFKLAYDLCQAGMVLVSVVSWYRDRHIVTTKSRKLSNTWEPIFILARQEDYIIDRQSATKVKKGFEGREGSFDEDEYETCVGDHWPIRNDRRDRRFLPMNVVMNCGQLACLQSGHRVYDPYGNPGVKNTCKLLGWEYVDGGLPCAARAAGKDKIYSGE